VRLVDSVTVRQALGRHLRGNGLELGPGHSPFAPLPPGVTVRYVDRWQPEENASLFGELGPDAGFVVPDVRADLDIDRLHAFADRSEDFVIASHVLEHVADPIGLLGEVHRVLRPGGTVLILLPDRHRTFDRARRPTSLEHLVAEHEAGVTVVDDDHLEEFLTNAYEDPAVRHVIPDDAAQRSAFFDLHRRRSIHVHCWDQDEFVAVLAHCIGVLGQRWEFVDAVMTPEEGPGGMEFGFLLRRGATEEPPAEALERFTQSWSSWHRARTLWLHVEADREAVTGLELRLAAEVASLREELAATRAALVAPPVGPAAQGQASRPSRGLRRLAGRLRRRVARLRPGA
jgi:hypothetical protein